MAGLQKLELTVLSAICEIIDRALDLEAALEDVLGILSDNLSMKRATVTLKDPQSELLVITVSHGLTPEEKARGVYTMDEGVTGRIFRTAKPYVVPDIRTEPLFLDKTGSRKIERGRISFIGVPILLHGHPIGVLNVDRLFDDHIAFEEDVRFLSVVATLIAQFLSLNEKVRERIHDLQQENISLKSRLSKEAQGLYIVGQSGAMLDVQRQIEKVAPTKATVLLLGESGTGKTLIARIIHDLSDRKNHPFVKVNCASIPETLLESELFGYEKGAFTGATAPKAGRFEDAHRGTIFLDEIGELPLGIQAKLLRVLQEKEFERLGSNQTRKVDVRIMTATNKDLAKLAAQGAFRPDLYYRLNVFPIKAPPLRERKEDIPRLINHFLTKVSREYGRTLSLSAEALNLVKSYDWPGNVREMENLVERLVIMAEGNRINAELIAPYLSGEYTESPAASGSPEAVPTAHNAQGALSAANPVSLKDMEKNEVVAALARNDWVQQRAARDLGLTERQMGYRVRKFGLEGLIASERAKLRDKK